jgi:hypothetical protein
MVMKITDVFDQHDTEDCPCQAMDYEEDTPSPSHHHGERKQSRPYCDICEGKNMLLNFVSMGTCWESV